MKGFDVIHAKSAVKARNKMDLSFSHLTTMDFGQIQPLFAREMIPADEFNVDGRYFSRMAPLAKPTYGKFSFKTVSAFVPYYMVAEDADAWLAGKTVWEGSTPIQRCITIGDLFEFIRAYCTTTTGANSSNSQLTYLASDGSVAYRIYTNVGRYWIKVLNSLGYATPQNVDLQTTSTWTTDIKHVKLSAYPLLAFFKLYNDYMSQSQRFNTSALSAFLQNIKYNKTASGYIPSAGIISFVGIKVMFDNLLLNYENDYFTSAWQVPNQPLSSGEYVNSAAVPAEPNGDYVANNGYDNYTSSHTTSYGGADWINLGQRALDFLRSFDDWVRRNNYSGSRSVQNVFSRFGIKTDDYRSHYANVISTDEMPVQVGDITSTADTTGAILGEYSGKGIMNGSKSVYFKSSDYGILFVLGYFTVTPMNAYGFDRSVLRTSPFDYYNPEFDGIGAEAISVSEFYENPTEDPSGDSTSMLDVYGFTERYNSYRYGRDMITGDFRDYRNTGDMNCWHTGRNMSAIRHAGNLVAQSSSVNTLPQTDSEYNRIFSVTNSSVDHFYLTARFNVSAVRPMLNLNQVPRLGEGDTLVPRNGNVIS